MKISITQRLAFTTVLAGLVAPHALAQTVDNPFFRDRFVAVQDRPQPEFDPVPVRAGAFTVDSSVGVGAAYNDNVYVSASNAVEDTVLTFNPKVDIASGWSTHALVAGVDVSHRKYLNEDSEDATDTSGYLAGRLDVVRDFSLGARLSAASLTEMRYAPSSITFAAEPTQYDFFGGELNANFRRDRTALRGEIGTRTFDYDDVNAVPGAPGPAVVDQDFRDYTENYIGGRLSYAWSPDLAFYLQGNQADVDHDEFVGVPTRDGSRTTVQVGTDFELSAPFRGDIAVGYFEDKRDAVQFAGSDGLSVDGRLIWFPTQLTTFTFTGSRSSFDPGLIGSATATNTTFGVRADHELRRNLLLYADARTSTQDFESIDRSDDILDLGLGLGLRLNRNARFDFGYTLRNQDSSGLNADRAFDQNILSAGLRFYP